MKRQLNSENVVVSKTSESFIRTDIPRWHEKSAHNYVIRVRYRSRESEKWSQVIEIGGYKSENEAESDFFLLRHSYEANGRVKSGTQLPVN
jgi:hypothetical protein